MARWVNRWLAVGLVACLAILVALWPTPQSRRTRPEPQRASLALSRAQNELDDALDVLRLLEVRDSLLLRWGTTSPDSLVIGFDPGILEKDREFLRGMIEPRWEQIRPHRSDVRVAIAVLIDTARTYAGRPRTPAGYFNASHLLPEVTDGVTCVTIVDLGLGLGAFPAERTTVPRWAAQWTAERALGPCGFYAAFGIPGRRVREWLEQWAYMPARQPEWSGGSAEDRPPAVRSRRGTLEGFDFDFLSCADGRRERCSAALSRGPYGMRRVRLSAEDRMTGLVRERWMPFATLARTPLGPAVRSFLADMVSEFGPERFERFWTSERDLQAAFANATGRALDEWMVQWTRRQVGEPELGTTVPLGSVTLSLLAVGLLLGGAGLVAIHRQVK